MIQIDKQVQEKSDEFMTSIGFPGAPQISLTMLNNQASQGHFLPKTEKCKFTVMGKDFELVYGYNTKSAAYTVFPNVYNNLKTQTPRLNHGEDK